MYIVHMDKSSKPMYRSQLVLLKDSSPKNSSQLWKTPKDSSQLIAKDDRDGSTGYYTGTRSFSPSSLHMAYGKRRIAEEIDMIIGILDSGEYVAWKIKLQGSMTIF